MNFYYFFLLISALWFVSEIILARVKNSSKIERSQKKDKGSLQFLWIVILTSIIAGVLFAMNGIGAVRNHLTVFFASGILLILIGLIIRWIAILSLKKNFTVDVSIQKNHQIKTDGIYRSIRHPAYLGSLLSFLGLGLAFSNWISTLVIFVPILVVFLLRIRVEEKALIDFFGDEYQEYCLRTKRLLPGIF